MVGDIERVSASRTTTTSSPRCCRSIERRGHLAPYEPRLLVGGTLGWSIVSTWAELWGYASRVAVDSVQRDVKAHGIRLRVSEWGSGPSIVLLHGLFLNRETWTPVAELLARRFRVVSPDLPGFGDSEKPTESRFPYGIESFVSAIVDLYAGLELGRAVLVGHDLGGAVGITLAARHPELISRLVLISALCYPPRRDALRRVATTPVLGGLVFKQLLGRAAFRNYFRERYLAPRSDMSTARVDRYFESFNAPSARASALATIRATRDTRSVVADVARVNTPSLVLWGRDDGLFPASMGQRMARELPNAGLHLLSAGHAPQEETPADVAEAIQRFCTQSER